MRVGTCATSSTVESGASVSKEIIAGRGSGKGAYFKAEGTCARTRKASEGCNASVRAVHAGPYQNMRRLRPHALRLRLVRAALELTESTDAVSMVDEVSFVRRTYDA